MMWCCSLFHPNKAFLGLLRRYLRENADPENNQKNKVRTFMLYMMSEY